MENLKLYPNGFIFSDEKIFNIPEYYRHKDIIGKYNYYYDKKVDSNIYEYNNCFLLIHGDFIYVDSKTTKSNHELLEYLMESYLNNYNEFLNALDYIGGRYTIIVGIGDDIKIFPDAAHTRSTYFTNDDYNIVSSHVHLINDQIKYKKSDISYAQSNALFYTPYEMIRSLIPNFYVDLKSKKYTRFFPREANKYNGIPENEKFELVERFWIKQLDFFFKKYDNAVLSLTGGGDSRFSLAMLKNHLEKVQFFTYAHSDEYDTSNSTKKMFSIDNIIVKQILKDINLNHKFFYFDKDKRVLTEKEKGILNKNTISKHSTYLIPFFLSNYPQESIMHIRGNLLEIGQTRYYKKEMRDSNIFEIKKSFDSRYKKFLKENDNIEEYEKNFDEFIMQLNYGNHIYDYHLLDLLHWEIRMGRWHPEILNSHDPVFDTVTPYNHRALIDISLSFSYAKRRDEYMFKELINRNFPTLNFYGDNNVLNLYEQQRNKKYKNKE